jgi:hypothetical protein
LICAICELDASLGSCCTTLLISGWHYFTTWSRLLLPTYYRFANLDWQSRCILRAVESNLYVSEFHVFFRSLQIRFKAFLIKTRCVHFTVLLLILLLYQKYTSHLPDVITLKILHKCAFWIKYNLICAQEQPIIHPRKADYHHIFDDHVITKWNTYTSFKFLDLLVSKYKDLNCIYFATNGIWLVVSCRDWTHSGSESGDFL